jgi:hypothetical protein
MERPSTLEEVGFKRDGRVLVCGRIYIVKKLLNLPKHDYLLVENEDGDKFKVLVNVCQHIDSEVLI